MARKLQRTPETFELRHKVASNWTPTDTPPGYTRYVPLTCLKSPFNTFCKKVCPLKGLKNNGTTLANTVLWLQFRWPNIKNCGLNAYSDGLARGQITLMGIDRLETSKSVKRNFETNDQLRLRCNFLSAKKLVGLGHSKNLWMLGQMFGAQMH